MKDKVGEDETVLDSYIYVFDYPLGVSNCGICKLYEHAGLGESRIL